MQMHLPHQPLCALQETDDMVQQSFPAAPPMVVCFVRHLDRSMAQITTPPCVERCVVDLQLSFQPFVAAARVHERCLSGSRLFMQFGKAIDADAGARSSLLNIFIFAVHLEHSRPRVFAQIVKEWRARLEKAGHVGKCFVMLFHEDLVDAASLTARRATGEETEKTHNQTKANAAVAVLETYFDELRAQKFAPHQMCAYLPTDAPVRVMERLRAAYEERSAQLFAIFNLCQQQQRQPQRQRWSLRECWRVGYDLVRHFFQFSAIADAAAVLARMFDLYYYNSEDYGFLKERATLVRLGSQSDLFSPVSIGAILQDGCSGFPDSMCEDVEFVNGLLFITACEIRCLLLLGRRDAAFSRVCAFLQVAREKLSESDTATLVGDVCRLTFLLRCFLSAMCLQCRSYKNGSSNNSHGNDNSSSPCTLSAQGSEALASPLMSSFLAADQQTISLTPPPRSEQNSISSHTKDTDGIIEDESDANESQGLETSWNRWNALCVLLGVDTFDDEKKERISHVRRVARFASNALDILNELGELLGYYSEHMRDAHLSRTSAAVQVNTDSSDPENAAVAAAREAVQSFEVPELLSADAFINFYRTVAELAALSFRLLGCRHMEHEVYYRLALSHLPDNPTVTADICRERLIPFILQHGWLQLQDVVHRLYVDTMDIIVKQRKAAGLTFFLSKEEALMLREALLRMIHTLGTEWVTSRSNDLEIPIDLVTYVELADDLWFRFCHVDTMLARSAATASIMPDAAPSPSGPFSLLTLFSNTRVVCEPETDSALARAPVTPVTAGPFRAQIGDTVQLRLTTDCLLSAFGSVDRAAELTATLVSKKDWADAEEPTHVLAATHVVAAARDAGTGRVSWAWAFSPCHAGAYRLRSVALSAAGASLVYGHSDAGRAADERYAKGCGKEDSTDVVLIVPEPDAGMHVRVVPPAVPHCFGDAMSHITVHAEIEKSLYLPLTSHRTALHCTLEPAQHALRHSLPSRRSFLSTLVSKSEVTGLPHAHPDALAVICVSRARRAASSRAHLHNNYISGCENCGSDESEIKLFVVNDECSGSSTTVPVDEAKVMSQLQTPALISDKTKADRVRLRVDGCMLLQRHQCFYNIYVQDDSPASGKPGEVLDATSLRCDLPLLPLVMAPGEDTPATVSLRCQRGTESCSADVTVPLRFAQAFSVRYAFRCSQSRIYCTARVENVLPSTSLWLRGALLDLLDTEPYYTLARVSSTYERLTTREWRAGETVQLLFELAPTAKQPQANAEEVQHRVRLQLFYSHWSATEEFDSLVTHTLRPFSEPAKSSLQMLDGKRTSKLFNSIEGHSNNNSFMDHSEMEVSPSPYRDDDEYGAGLMIFSQQSFVRFDPVRIEELRYQCNTFHGPVTTFTSHYSCLFNAIIFVYSNNASSNHVSTHSAADTAAVNSPNGAVFPAGEPIRFSVQLEPLAHNWPEGSACEEDFIVCFVADPAAWLVTGRQNVRAVLSMMDDATFSFTAVPVPPSDGKEEQSIVAVATPSVEIRWAAQPCEAPVAIEVVQFRTSMPIRL